MPRPVLRNPQRVKPIPGQLVCGVNVITCLGTGLASAWFLDMPSSWTWGTLAFASAVAWIATTSQLRSQHRNPSVRRLSGTCLFMIPLIVLVTVGTDFVIRSNTVSPQELVDDLYRGDRSIRERADLRMIILDHAEAAVPALLDEICRSGLRHSDPDAPLVLLDQIGQPAVDHLQSHFPRFHEIGLSESERRDRFHLMATWMILSGDYGLMDRLLSDAAVFESATQAEQAAAQSTARVLGDDFRRVHQFIAPPRLEYRASQNGLVSTINPEFVSWWNHHRDRVIVPEPRETYREKSFPSPPRIAPPR